MTQLALSLEVEARQQIERIKQHWRDFWFELKDFHDYERWHALGFSSFKACVEQELGLSERRAYQLLEAAAVAARLGAENIFSTTLPNEVQARSLAPLLKQPEVLADAWQEVLDTATPMANGTPKVTAALVDQVVARRVPKSHDESWAERREAIMEQVRQRPTSPDADFYGRIVQSGAMPYLQERETGKTDLCLTSPPYWAKRTYFGGEEELGQERTPAAYLTALRTIIREIGRVLSPTGWLFLNLGDTLANQPGRYRGDPNRARGVSTKVRDAAGGAMDGREWDVPDKSLCLIPWRLLDALVREDGWRCRNVIVWRKLGHQPENVGDRLTQAWEPIFALTRGEFPYYDRRAIEERPIDVWELAVGRNGDGGLHPAVFPDALVERTISLACPPGGVVLDPFAGSGTVLHVAQAMGRRFLGCDLIDWRSRGH